MKRLSVLVVITAVLTALLLSGCALEGAHVVGPAGGPVFYDKGTYSNGWRYLELSPKDAGTAKWSGGTDISGLNTGDGIGAGFENTLNILARLGEEAAAARLCDDFSYGGYDDWFFPSVKELEAAIKAYPARL
jgi:hypothetical protein